MYVGIILQLIKKQILLNILTQEIDPSIKKAKVYYYKELNCTKVD